MNIMGLILVIILYPFVLLMYFLLKNDATPKKNMYFGVTLDKEQKKDEDVDRIVKEYDKQMKKYLLILTLLPIPLLFIPWFSIFLTGWMIWLLATCFAFFIPFGQANMKLKELKAEKGWNEKQSQQIFVEMKAAGSVRKVKWYHFLPQNILTVLMVLWTLSTYQDASAIAMHILVISFATITPLFWLMAIWMDKQKTQIISMDSNVNINYNRAKKNIWKNFWSICCWINVLYMVSMPLALNSQGNLTHIFWVTTVLYIVLTFVLIFWLMKKKNDIDSRYRPEIFEDFADDDSHWYWGIIYYNPKDKHSMVEKRVGMGTSVNMATPVGKGFAVFGGLSLLVIPVICIWLILLEFTPIQLQLIEGQIVARHLRNEYAISLNSIEDAELIAELPKMSKNHGTSMDHLKKGSFLVSEGDRCTVFANPENGLFIRLEADGTTYYLSGYDDAETRRIYDALH